MKPLHSTRQNRKRAFLDTVPVMAGYLVLGIGFGILLQSKGYGVWWAFGMSACIYAGSMQYLAIDLLSGAASLLTAALTALAVNARHLFYGISMVDRYKHQPFLPFLAFTLTDETYSLVCREEKPEADYLILVSLLDYFYWVLGSVLGSLLGSILPFSTEGIDFALTALFLSVFTEQVLSKKALIPNAVGVAASLAALWLFGADGFLIPAMLLILLVLTLLRRKLEAHHV